MPYSGMYFPEGLYSGVSLSSGNYRNSDGDKYTRNDIDLELSYLFPGRTFELMIIGEFEDNKYEDASLSGNEMELLGLGFDLAYYLINDNDAMRFMIHAGYAEASLSNDVLDMMEAMGGTADISASNRSIGARFFGLIPSSVKSLRITPFFGYKFWETEMESYISYQGNVDCNSGSSDGSETVFGAGITFGRLLVEPSVARSDNDDYYAVKIGFKL